MSFSTMRVASLVPARRVGLSSPLFGLAPLATLRAAHSSSSTSRSLSASSLHRRFSSSPRPVSPHVQIYDFPLPALTSITNRVTGVALAGGFYGMGLIALFGHCDLTSCVVSFQTAAPFLVPVAKMAVGFPFVYHYLAGLRHLHWDATAKNLDLPAVERSSKLLVASSAGLSLLLAFVSI